MPVSSPEIAELAKLVENTFRFINISFINEMALLCDRLGVNVWEVIEAAKTKPFAFMAHYPSPGVGGHCIPVVPQYFRPRRTSMGLHERADSGRVPHQRGDAQAGRRQARAARWERGKRWSTRSVLLVGMTYKPDIADMRESAALRVLEEALVDGARSASYHDPLMPTVTRGRRRRRVGRAGPDGYRGRLDAVVLLTPHTSIDYDRIIASARLVVDTHSGLQPREAPNVVNVWVPESLDSRILA